DGSRADPAHAAARLIGEEAVQTRHGAGHQLETGLRILLTDEAEQTYLIHMAQTLAFSQLGGAIERQGRTVRPRMIEAHAEEETFRQGLLRTCLQQIVVLRPQTHG